VRFLRHQFLQDGELQFTDVLSEGTVAHALKALNVGWSPYGCSSGRC
jgi:hypothetical protein